MRPGLWGISVGLAFCLSLAAARGQDPEMPPDVGMIAQLACHREHTAQGWKTTVRAEYANPAKYNGGKPWTQVLSIRKSYKKAMRDCDRWMAKLNKAMEQARRGT